MDGNEYNNENTKGKIIILKCWFINCPLCIAEFPELNAFVERYRNRKDILFISLALDTKSALEKFLLVNRFNYIVIPDQKEFIGNILNINDYPTHFIIGRNGVIKKVVNKADEMILAFDRDESMKK
jgi:thiol-disulfide isomerase/thioredoxin